MAVHTGACLSEGRTVQPSLAQELTSTGGFILTIPMPQPSEHFRDHSLVPLGLAEQGYVHLRPVCDACLCSPAGTLVQRLQVSSRTAPILCLRQSLSLN